MNKAFRQGQILKLIRARAIHTQQDLARALKAQKIPATQVTLSRDIREIGLVKTPNGYAVMGEEAVVPRPTADVSGIARELILDVRVAQNLLVLKTPPANANALAAALDRADWGEMIVGTIAGDDTVLIVTPDKPTASELQAKLLKLLR